LSDISATLARIHTKYYLYMDNVCRRAPSPCGAHRPLEGGGGGVKNSKNWGWSHSCIGQLPFLFLSSDAKCSPICRAQTCAHSGVEPSRSAKAFLQGGPKSSKKFRIFTISRLYVHISQKLLKIEAYKQYMEKSFISPLSNCRMCLDPSVTGFYRVSQKVSDVIPVLRLTSEWRVKMSGKTLVQD